jgi:hypothetical protein
VRVKYRRQARHLENFAHEVRNVAQLQVSFGLPSGSQGADHSAESAAIDESNLAKVQDDGTAVAQQPSHMLPERITLASRYDASIAVNDGDASNLTGIKR